ncbi:hypothetical protein M9458_031567, partial [Cirrhinus mrigala]
CNEQPRARSPTRSNQPTPPMRSRRRLLPAKRAGQTNRSRKDTEPQNPSRAKPGELHMEKDRS